MSGGWENALSARELKKKQKNAQRLKERERAIRQQRAAEQEEEQRKAEAKRKAKEESYRIGKGKGGVITFSLEGTKAESSKKTRKRRTKKAPSSASAPSKKSVTISSSDLDAAIAKAAARYDDVQLQQREVASFLEQQMTNAKKFDPNQMQLADDFEAWREEPVSWLKQPIVASVSKWINRQPNASISGLFWLLLREVSATDKVDSVSNGNGMLLLLQLLVRNKAGAIFKNKDFRQSMKPYLVQTKKADSLDLVHHLPAGQHVVVAADVGLFTWIFAQIPEASATLSLTLWAQMLLPHVGLKLANARVRSAVAQAGDYLTEENAEAFSERKPQDVPVLVSAMERLVVMAHSPVLAPPLRQVVDSIHTSLKESFLFDNESSKPFAFFTAYLGQVTPENEGNSGLHEEVVETAIRLLVNDPRCYESWLEAYPSSFVQSNELLRHLANQGSSLRMADGVADEMGRALRRFRRVNSDILATNPACKLATAKTVKLSADDVAASNKNIKSILAVLDAKPLWHHVFMLLHLLLALGVVYLFFGSKVRAMLEQ